MVVSNLASLSKNISSGSNEVSSIKTWLELGRHKLSLGGQFVSVFHRMDGIILVGKRTNTHIAFSFSRNLLTRINMILKMNSLASFPKTLQFNSRLKHPWKRCLSVMVNSDCQSDWVRKAQGISEG